MKEADKADAFSLQRERSYIKHDGVPEVLFMSNRSEGLFPVCMFSVSRMEIEIYAKQNYQYLLFNKCI